MTVHLWPSPATRMAIFCLEKKGNVRLDPNKMNGPENYQISPTLEITPRDPTGDLTFCTYLKKVNKCFWKKVLGFDLNSHFEPNLGLLAGWAYRTCKDERSRTRENVELIPVNLLSSRFILEATGSIKFIVAQTTSRQSRNKLLWFILRPDLGLITVTNSWRFGTKSEQKRGHINYHHFNWTTWEEKVFSVLEGNSIGLFEYFRGNSAT